MYGKPGGDIGKLTKIRFKLPVIIFCCLILGLTAGAIFAWHIIHPPKAILGLETPSISVENKGTINQNSQPKFSLDTKGLIKSSKEEKNRGALELTGSKISAEVVKEGKVLDSKPEISTNQNQVSVFEIGINDLAFSPGKYTLKINLNTSSSNQTVTQDFTGGVLALNFNQSSYKVGDNVQMGMSVLDDGGHTLCDSKVIVTILDPSNQTTILSTDNQSISVSQECADINITTTPDYLAEFTPASEGEYKVELTAETANGQRKMEDTFTVNNNPDFVISHHDTATRIYPVTSYAVNFDIWTAKDFSGVVREKVPASFSISDLADDGEISSKNDSGQTISWPIEIKAGETKSISYRYQPPTQSPQFYLLSPVALWQPLPDSSSGEQKDTMIFSEPHPWQIAADALRTCATTATGTWNWETAAKWTGDCATDGVYPGQNLSNTYAVTINSTGTATHIDLTASHTNLTTLTINNNTRGDTLHLNGFQLSMSSTVTLVQTTSNYTNLIDVNSGRLDAASISLQAATSSGRVARLTVGSGQVNTTGNISYTGAGTNDVTFTAGQNGTINVGGNFLPATLTTNTTGKVNANGSAAQSLGTFTYYNVDVNNTGDASTYVTFAGNPTIAGDLNVNDGTLENEASDRILDCNGAVTIGAQGTLIASSTASFTIAGNYSNSGTLTPGSGTITFDGASPAVQTLDGGGTGAGKAFNTLTHSGTSTLRLVTSDLDVNGTFTNSDGTFDDDTNDKNMNFAAAWNNTGTAYFTTGSGTLTFDGTSTVTNSSSNASTLGAVAVSGTATLGSNLTIISATGAGTLNLGAGSYTLTITGTGTPLTVSTFSKGTGSTVLYTGTSSDTYIATVAYNAVTITPTAATNYYLTNNLSCGSVFTVNDHATVDTTVANSYSLTTSQLAINTGGAFTANNSTITLSGSSTPFNRAGGTFTAGGSTLVFSYGLGAISSMFYATGSPTHNVYNITISGANIGSFTDAFCSAACSINIGGALDIIPGGPSGLVTVNTSPSASVTVTGTTTVEKTSGATSKLQTADGQTITLGSFIIAAGGTYAPGAGATTLINGSFTNNGTFTANSDLVKFQSTTTAIVAGSTTFYDLTLDATASGAKEIDFTAGTHQTINNTFTLTGSVGKVLTLRSTSLNSAWYFVIPADMVSGTYIDVEDSQNNTNAYRITAGADVTNSGNNDPGWIFGSPITNDSLTFTNPYGGSGNTAIADDTTSWQFQAKVTDTNGPTDINYIEIRFANGTDSTLPYDSLKYRYTRGTDTFSEEADTQSAGTITSVAGDASAVGNQWTVNFKIKFNNNFSVQDTQYNIELYSLSNGALSDDDDYANKYQVTTLSLSLDVDSATLSFGDLLPGSVVTGTTITDVTTNYPNGYALAASDGVVGSYSCLLHTDSSTRIADYAGTIDIPTLWSDTGLGITVWAADTTPEAKWCDSTCTSEIDPDNKYAGVPETAATIHTKTGSPTSSNHTSVGYKLVVPNSQKTGTYSGTITYTATGALN